MIRTCSICDLCATHIPVPGQESSKKGLSTPFLHLNYIMGEQTRSRFSIALIARYISDNRCQPLANKRSQRAKDSTFISTTKSGSNHIVSCDGVSECEWMLACSLKGVFGNNGISSLFPSRSHFARTLAQVEYESTSNVSMARLLKYYSAQSDSHIIIINIITAVEHYNNGWQVHTTDLSNAKMRAYHIECRLRGKFPHVCQWGCNQDT